MRRNNIEGMRHNNDMVAVAMKVNEWNAEGKNFCFFFKQLGNFFLFNIKYLIFFYFFEMVFGFVHYIFDGDW